jgi:hypothetical protein
MNDLWIYTVHRYSSKNIWRVVEGKATLSSHRKKPESGPWESVMAMKQGDDPVPRNLTSCCTQLMSSFEDDMLPFRLI